MTGSVNGLAINSDKSDVVVGKRPQLRKLLDLKQINVTGVQVAASD